MDLQPKTEPWSPHHENLKDMSIRDLVSELRTAFRMEEFDSVEEVLLTRDERLNAEIGKLREMVEMEKLTRFYAEGELRKREEQCERGKIAQDCYEILLKKVKMSGLVERDHIAELRKKNAELECEICDIRKSKGKFIDDSNMAIFELRKKIGELVSEVCELNKLKQKWVDDSNALTKLRIRVSELENDKNTLATIRVKNSELEEAMKKNLATINELVNENTKLVDEKHGIEMLVESLNRKYEELLMRVDASLDGKAEVSVSEKDVGECEFGNDTMEAYPLEINEHAPYSLGVAGIAPSQSKGSMDAQGASSVMGRLESEKEIGVIDTDEDDECTSERPDGKKAISGIIMKDEHPNSSMKMYSNRKRRM